MNPLFQAAQLTDEQRAYWANTLFAQELIKLHNVAVQSGLTLKMAYPDKAPKANTTNIAEIPYQNMQLGEYIVKQYSQDTNTTFSNKKSNWVLLVHMLLEQTACYMEASSEKFRQKIIATRNLAVANTLCGSPVKNFEVFYKLLSQDINYFNSLRAHLPAELVDGLIAMSQTIVNKQYSLSDAELDWFVQTFQSDKNTIKILLAAYKLFYTESINSECIENKCAYLKLTADDKGHLSLPKRFSGTRYAVTMDTIMVPLQFMREQAAWLCNHLNNGLIFVQFKRDNDVLRDMLATANPQVLQAVYKDNAPTFSASYVESRGYIRCVDICCSAIADDLFRAISLARILGVKLLSPDLSKLDDELRDYGFSSSFANVSLTNVVPSFKQYISRINTNIAFLTMIYKGINPSVGDVVFTSPYQVEFAINQYVDLQDSLTSSFARKLHLFMLNNPMLFPGYTGEPEDLTGTPITTNGGKFQSLGLA